MISFPGRSTDLWTRKRQGSIIEAGQEQLTPGRDRRAIARDDPRTEVLTRGAIAAVAKGNGKRPGPSAQELRAFRHQVSLLKKAGLVSKRTDARKQKATRYMKAKVKSLSPVLAGDMAGVKVARDVLARYREGGFKIVNGRVLVNKDHDEIAKAKKGELISLRKLTPNYPYEKVVMPYRINSMPAFFAEAKKSPPDPVLFSSRKNAPDNWAFTFYGWNSLMTFSDLGLLAEYLEHYAAIEGTAPEDQTEVFENFILYRASDGWSPRHRPGFSQTKRKSTRTVQDRRLDMRGRAKMAAAETYAERNARNQQAFRDRRKEQAQKDANFASEVKKKQRERMAAYRKGKKTGGQ